MEVTLKYKYSFILFLIGFILQSSVMHHISIFGVTPNLILCLVIIFSFLYDDDHGIVFGLIFGLIQDICFSEIIGVAAISYLLIALLCLELNRYLYKESLISILIVSSIGTISYGLFYWGIIKMLGSEYEFIYMLKMEAILLIYNGIVMLIMYLIMSRRVIKHQSDRYIYQGNLSEARSLNRL